MLLRAALIWISCAIAGFAADWRMFMGNHYLTGNNDQVVPDSFAPLWRKPLGSRVFHAVSDGVTVFATTLDRRLHALSLADGARRWQASLEGPAIRMPVIEGNLLFVAAGRSLSCHDTGDGRLVWRRSSGTYSQLATPIVEDGVVYYGSRGSFFAYRATNGRPLWTNAAIKSYGASPIYCDGRIFTQHRDYGTGLYTLACLDAGDGRTLWQARIPADANVFTPLVLDGRVYMASATGIEAFAVADGRRLAVREMGARVGTSPLAADGLLYLSDAAGRIHVLRPDDLGTVTTFPNHSRQGTWFAGAGMRFYLVAESGELLELDKNDGAVMRRTPIEGRPERGIPLLFAGRVVLPVGEQVHCFGAPEGARPVIKPPKASPDVLLVRLIDGKTGEPLFGSVRLVLGDGIGDRTLHPVAVADRPLSLEMRVFPATLRIEKVGYHATSRVFPAPESGRIVVVRLDRLRDGDGVVLENVRFASDSSALSAESLPALEALTRFLRDNPDYGALIRGHTDATGDAGRNERLSAERARVVRDYLVKQNIAALRLRVEGCGSREPVADNADEAGRRLNRRTEVRFFMLEGKGGR